MAALARLQASSCAAPTLDLFTQVGGILTDVESVQFQIFDRSTGVGVQVYPVTDGEKETVNVDDDCPTGDRLSVGRYVARWEVPVDSNLGTHYIKWFFQLTGDTPEQTFIEEFEVLAEVIGSGDGPLANYCLIQDLRDEGVPVSVLDAHIQQRIALASRMIEQATKRFFFPKAMTITMDGRGGNRILLSDPIIAIESVAFDTTPWAPSATNIEMDLVKIYSRHLTEGLTSPDDRNNPKIELFTPAEMLTHYGSSRGWSRLNFPRGQRNVTITGIFGYTDPDGSTTGKTPDLIRHATKLLVFKELDKMSRTAARFDHRARHRLTSERTRDQAYTLEPLGTARGAFFSGDPEVDNILAAFMRPPSLGAA